ncbi:MAG: SUMF1/EgtB/PvdO family nonheme iron enzyme [Elusimicrobiales bacterium]|nr:SUMF1/EgtB/PvdO family nonheme iron enzyme [Elusimicrobiales bacterium]
MKTTFTLLSLWLLLTGAADCFAQRASRGDSELISYIRSGTADPACGVCLGSATKYFKERHAGELAKKTAGMALVPAGEYRIGAEKGKGEPDELPMHAVSLDAFYMDKTEVTLADYLTFAKTTGGNYPEWAKPSGKFNLETGKEKYYRRLEGLIKDCPSCPVFGIFWSDAAAYCAYKKRRLPTEAEWEAAATGGTSVKYNFRDSTADAGNFAWFAANSGELPHKTACKSPNAFGMYDMNGNVWEWVSDFYGRNYYQASPRRNPKGPETGKEHVIRGGSWASDADEMASTNRASYGKANDDIGFRCAASQKDILAELEP